MEEVTQRGQPRRTSAGGTHRAGIGQRRREDTIDRSTVPISWAVMDPSPSLSKISNASLCRGWRGEESRWPSPARGSTLRRAERECKRTCIPPPAPPRSCACALVHRSALSRASQPGPLVPQSPAALFGWFPFPRPRFSIIFRHSSEAEHSSQYRTRGDPGTGLCSRGSRLVPVATTHYTPNCFLVFSPEPGAVVITCF